MDHVCLVTDHGLPWIACHCYISSHISIIIIVIVIIVVNVILCVSLSRFPPSSLPTYCLVLLEVSSH